LPGYLGGFSGRNSIIRTGDLVSKQQFKLGWMWMSLVVVAGAAACRSEQLPLDPPEPGVDAPAPVFVGPARPVELALHAALAFHPTAGG
jgi:hypothetical protein